MPQLAPGAGTTLAPAVGHGALPLPPAGWGVADALAAFEAARPALPAGVLAPAAVLGELTTVVLDAGEHVVKVYPPGTDAGHLDAIHAVLGGSTSATVACVPAVSTVHGVVTVSRRVPGGTAVTWSEVGTALRRFHDENGGKPVPAWAPLSRLAAQVTSLPAVQAEVLLTARDVLLAALSGVRSELGYDTIHGDVSPSNVLRDGRAVTLIDLDWVARGPREYDLASASRRFRAGEIDRATYRSFCRAYGHDVLGWEGLPLMDRVADLSGVVFRIWDCRHHGRDLDWLPEELRLWRTPL
jgi:hypothetical protein